MSDRYTFSDHPPQPEGWPASYDAKEEPMQLHQGEAVYEASRDVLQEMGLPIARAVRLAEMIRKRVMGK